MVYVSVGQLPISHTMIQFLIIQPITHAKVVTQEKWKHVQRFENQCLDGIIHNS